jgi:hypothetical protein
MSEGEGVSFVSSEEALSRLKNGKDEVGEMCALGHNSGFSP